MPRRRNTPAGVILGQSASRGPSDDRCQRRRSRRLLARGRAATLVRPGRRLRSQLRHALPRPALQGGAAGTGRLGRQRRRRLHCVVLDQFPRKCPRQWNAFAPIRWRGCLPVADRCRTGPSGRMQRMLCYLRSSFQRPGTRIARCRCCRPPAIKGIAHRDSSVLFGRFPHRSRLDREHAGREAYLGQAVLR